MKNFYLLKFLTFSIFLVLLLNSEDIYGQKKSQCTKLVYVKKDDFTNKTIISSKEDVKIFDATAKNLLNNLVDNNDNEANWQVKLGFFKSDTSQYIVFTLYSSSSYADAVKKLYAKFFDGEVIEFKNGKSNEPKQPDAYSSFTESYFYLSNENLEKLSTSKIEKFRIVYEDNPREPVSEPILKKKKAIEIMELASCFVNSIREVAK